MDLDPATAGEMTRALGPLFMAGIRGPEIAEAFERLGLQRAERYFPGRAAPLGRASLPLVVSTFFNFSPAAVARSIPAVWDKTTPQQVLEAQLEGVDRSLRRAFANVDEAVLSEAVTLVRTVAEAATERSEGRPLFAAWAALDWPDESHLVLWYGHYLLREFRGDGHIAVLVSAGLTGIQALALHIAMVPALGPVSRPSRGWTDDQWEAALEVLRSDDWITRGEALALSPSGKKRRQAIEDRTDELDLWPYERIGAAGCQRLLQLAGPINSALQVANLTVNLPTGPPPGTSTSNPGETS